MTSPSKLSEQSLEVMCAQIEAWRAEHPGESVELSPEKQREIWAEIARRIRAGLNEEVK